MTTDELVGTIVSDAETPTFETVRIKLKTGQELKPGSLVRVPVSRKESSTLIGRVNSAYEHNPNEGPEDINVRDTLGIDANYPAEADSTTIYRQVEADLIEEVFTDADGKRQIRAPQSLPKSGTGVFLASTEETVFALGLQQDAALGLCLGTTVSGETTDIVLNRNVIQRHLFICGTTGSGKSYATGVVAEELIKHKLPVI